MFIISSSIIIIINIISTADQERGGSSKSGIMKKNDEDQEQTAGNVQVSFAMPRGHGHIRPFATAVVSQGTNLVA